MNDILDRSHFANLPGVTLCGVALVAVSLLFHLLGVSEAAASQAAPPQAVTGPAEEVLGAEVFLNGYVNPHGSQTAVKYEYGTTRRYGAVAPEVVEETAVGMKLEEVGEALFCLAPKTTYHYRMVASNRIGASFGKDRVFTTTRLHNFRSVIYRECPHHAPVVP